MRLCRFDNDRLGLLERDALIDVTAALDFLPRHAWPLPRFDPLIANLPAVRARAFEHIAGYCIGLDMTVRGPEERSLRKSVDSFTVLGPWFVTADAIADPSALDLRLTVNGEVRQQANTRDLILGIPELIEFATSFYTVHPGDVLLTGTPDGVGPVQPGDRLVAEIQGIGRMEVAIRAAV
ncbi:MAG: fumarylacetoacetate hydrolase family protein [Burkholderiales bacterium]